MVDFKRQVRLFNPTNFSKRKITIIGLGNIGSHAAICLTRLGISEFNLYDPDIIEAHNISSQSYGEAEINLSKVEAVSNQMKAINPNVVVTTNKEKFDSPEEQDIVIVGVDELETRRELATILKGKANLIIDGRIGGEQLEMYSALKEDDWAMTIPVGDGDEDPCGGRYISYVSYIIAALITCQVKKFLTEQAITKSIILHVPSLQVMKDLQW